MIDDYLVPPATKAYSGIKLTTGLTIVYCLFGKKDWLPTQDKS